MDDPDAYEAMRKMEAKDPLRVANALDRIDWRLQYGIPEMKFIGWVLVVFQALILWRVW